MNTTARRFSRNPKPVFDAAARGEVVTINHDRHSDHMFELKIRPRGEKYGQWVDCTNCAGFDIGGEVSINNANYIVVGVDTEEGKIKIKPSKKGA